MDVISVRGAQHILSNFYISSHMFRHEGLPFKSLEHAYQYLKAKYHEEHELAEDIPLCRTAYEAKVMSQGISVSPEWHAIKANIMKKLLQSKAESIPEFRQKLLSTDKVKLTHPVKDDFWGCWDGKGQDMFGQLLMQLRDNLFAQRGWYLSFE